MTRVPLAVVGLLIATACGTSEPEPSRIQDVVTCANEAVPYSVDYPADWYVVPADEQNGIPACTYFGPEPFEFQESNVPLQTGASVVVSAHRDCMLDEFEPASRRRLQLDGFPAREDVFVNPVEIFQYVVELRPGVECSQQEILVIRTEGEVPGDYEMNRAVVRQLAQTLDIAPRQ